jgi:hypothetical protein
VNGNIKNYQGGNKMIYKDFDGNERSLYWMVKYEPEWAANRIRVGEAAIEKLSRLQKTSSNSDNHRTLGETK